MADATTRAEPAPESPNAADTSSQIAAKAYAIYERGGRREGRSAEDWAEAERDVKKTSSATESAQKSGAQDEAKGMPRPDATAPSPGAVGKGGDPSKEEPVAKATAQPEPEAHAES